MDSFSTEESDAAGSAAGGIVKIWIKRARKGDVTSARALLEWAADYLESGEAMPPDLTSWLVEAFWRVADGESADSALALNLPRGRPSKGGDERALAIAIQVEELRAQGMPLEGTRMHAGVYALVGERCSISAAAVKKNHLKARLRAQKARNSLTESLLETKALVERMQGCSAR